MRDFEKENSFKVNERRIQWFPGHMMKTLRLIGREIKNVDMTITLLDARAPLSSMNREVDDIISSKPVLYILNKRDLADENITPQWVKYFRKKGAEAVPLNSKGAKNLKPVFRAVSRLSRDALSRRLQRGIVDRTVRIMTVGEPNVGKSTFINLAAGSAVARARDRPGVTRGKQVINIKGYVLVDMPGVLPRKFDSRRVAANRAFIGSVKDEILDAETLVCNLLGELRELYPDNLCARYKLEREALEKEPYDILLRIGRKRGMLVSGGRVDTRRAAAVVLDEFRGNKLGGITLERPDDNELSL